MKTDAEIRLLQTDLYKWIRPEAMCEKFGHLHHQGWSLSATSGCFDIVHAGHVRLLRQAAQLADFLVICLNSDESIRRLKGPGRPIVPLLDRIEVLNSLEAVGYIVTFEDDTPEAALSIIRPNIYIKGGDYQHKDLPERAVVEKHGGVVQILPYHPGHSTTALWARLQGHEEGHNA